MMTDGAKSGGDRSRKPSLRCLQGGEGPDDLGADLVQLLQLPAQAREHFWEVLGAYLRPRLDERAQTTIVGFCTEHELTSEEIAPAIRATRFLFQEAARANLDSEAFGRDVADVSGEENAPALVGLLRPWFEDLRPRLRRELAERSIADHGKVVTGTDWRVDTIGGSNHAMGLNTPVAIVTFSYREGGQAGRVTLHLPPDQLEQLRGVALGMLG
jgi:hypothetical protein